MEFLADENVPGPIIRKLREDGFRVHAIAEEQAGISDSRVLEVAERRGVVLITQDNDFGELAILRRMAFSGVILLNLARLSLATQTERVARCFAHEQERFAGSFTVIEPARVRRRALGSSEPDTEA